MARNQFMIDDQSDWHVHDGRAYRTFDTETVPAGETRYFEIRDNSDSWSTFIDDYVIRSASENCTISFYRVGDLDNPSSVDTFNQRIEDPREAVTTVEKSSSASNLGQVVDEDYISVTEGVGNVPTIAGLIDVQPRVIPPQGDKLIIGVENTGSGSSKITVKIRFHEVEPRKRDS